MALRSTFSQLGLFSFLIAGLLSVSAAQANVGGISGGGGGVTNPKPASPESITNAVLQNGRIVLLSWFQAQEDQPTVYPAGPQASALSSKLFRGPNSIFTILQATGVEFHDQTACPDANGAAKDASIYPQNPGNICMSLFAMAPKLNERNVNSETLALLAHEMSHLTGTTEDEAVAIQEAVLRDLDQVSLADFSTAKSNARSDLNSLKTMVKWAAEKAIKNELGGTFDEMLSMIFDLQRLFMFNKKPFLMVSSDDLVRSTVNLARVSVVRAYYKTLPSNSDPANRGYFKRQLDLGFGTQSEATARDILTNGLHNHISANPIYDDVVIHRPTDGASAAFELYAFRDQVIRFMETLPYLNDKGFSTTRLN